MKKISSRQTAVIACVLLFANKILVLPSLLYEYAKADGLFVVFLLLIAEILLLLTFFRLKHKYPNSSFYEIIKKNMGVFLAKLSLFLILLYLFYKILLVYNVSYVYFRAQVYLNAGFYIFVLVFLLVCNSCVMRGLRSLSRCMEFFFTFIIICFVFCLLLSIANFNQFPIFFDTNILKFVESGFRYIFCFGDILLLFLLIDRIELDKKGEKQILVYVLTTMVLILILYLMFYSIFNYTSFVHKNAISDIITFSYRFTDLGRLDMVAIITVMFLSLFQISIALYVFCDCFIKLFPPLNKVYGLITFDLLFLTLIFISSIDYLRITYFGTLVMPYFAMVLQYVLPILCLLFTIGGKHEKNKG